MDEHLRPGRHIFVSYAREDRELVQRLRVGLQRLRHDVWVDDRLSVGQSWWSEILTQVRRCDAIVVAVSPALLESQASTIEREYGRRLGKRILPVSVRPVRTELLPPDIAVLQLVDYCTPGADAAFELADALASLPPSPALPDPLPSPPPVPVSYLSDLAARVHAATLSLDDQLAIVSRLRTALDRPSERDAAFELLTTLHGRTDLYHAAAREMEGLLDLHRPAAVPARDTGSPAAGTGRSGEARAPDPTPGVPPGWYPDPTGRHRLRWFEEDWTPWASDSGTVLDDPL